MEGTPDPPDMTSSPSRTAQEEDANTGEGVEGTSASGDLLPEPLGTKEGTEAGGKGGLPTEHAEDAPASGDCLPDALGTRKGTEACGKGGLPASGDCLPDALGTSKGTGAGGKGESPTEHTEDEPTGSDAGHTAGVKEGNDPQLYPSRSI